MGFREKMARSRYIKKNWHQCFCDGCATCGFPETELVGGAWYCDKYGEGDY